MPRSSNILGNLALAYILRENRSLNFCYFAPWLQIHLEMRSESSFSLDRSRTGLQSERKYGFKGNLWVSPESSTGRFILFNVAYVIIVYRYIFNFLLNNYFRMQQHGTYVQQKNSLHRKHKNSKRSGFIRQVMHCSSKASQLGPTAFPPTAPKVLSTFKNSISKI